MRKRGMRSWLRGHWVTFLYWCVFSSDNQRLADWAIRRIRKPDVLDDSGTN